jgi:post-segregation antitoxin (ccd killing protein)
MMLTAEVHKTRRLNIVVSEDLVECISSNAQSQGVTLSAFVRRAVERECARAQEAALAHAAEMLADHYAADKELTAFLALDGEPVL